MRRRGCYILLQSMTSLNILFFLLFCSPVRTNNIVDLIQSIRNKHANEQRSNNNFVTDFRDIIQTIQDHLYNTSAPICLPGFHSYGGSCYFLSPIKSTWFIASKTCALKRNSSLVSFETNEELEFVVEKLLKPNQVNQAYIGLYASDVGQWHWLDGRTFWDSIFGPLFYVYRPDTSRCGLLNLVNRTKTAIEGRDCANDEARFLCKYVQNHCYVKGICGRGGECMNLGLTYRCRCNFFYRGRRCDKFSSKAIQSIIALVILLLMGLGGCCLKFDLYSYCRKKKKTTTMKISSDQEIILGRKSELIFD